MNEGLPQINPESVNFVFSNSLLQYLSLDSINVDSKYARLREHILSECKNLTFYCGADRISSLELNIKNQSIMFISNGDLENEKFMQLNIDSHWDTDQECFVISQILINNIFNNLDECLEDLSGVSRITSNPIFISEEIAKQRLILKEERSDEWHFEF